MRVIALDLSTNAGYAVLERPVAGESGATQETCAALPKLLDHGFFEPSKGLPEMLSGTGYPWAYVYVARSVAKQAIDLALAHDAEVIAIEETNLGKKNRYAQKLLEFIHCEVAEKFIDRYGHPADAQEQIPRVVYISSSAWRTALGLALSKDDRKNNRALKKAKDNVAIHGGKLDKKALGIKGRVGTKHLSVRHVNTTYGLALKMKDNDTADAICIGLAYFAGAKVCDGAMG